MDPLWTWLVLVLKGNRRNLPFQKASENRTKIDLKLLPCVEFVHADDQHWLFVIRMLLFHHGEPLLETNTISHSGAVNSEFVRLYSKNTTKSITIESFVNLIPQNDYNSIRVFV